MTSQRELWVVFCDEDIDCAFDLREHAMQHAAEMAGIAEIPDVIWTVRHFIEATE